MKQNPSHAGFSVVELLIVITVLSVLAAVAVVSFWSTNKYSADDQAKKIADVFDEARQKALNQRKTFRVEINKTKRELRLIDEGNNVASANDDVILKKQSLSSQVVIGAAPSNVSGSPPASSPIPVPTYASSSYPLSNGDEKITLRFRRNGQVVDAGTDNTGAGSLVTGATIYVHSMKPSVTAPDVIRAVTVLGTTGDTSVYKCHFVLNNCTNWNR